LRANGKDMMKVQLIIQLCILVPILIFCIILTDKITKNIIQPIDRLAKILKKMKEGDLAVDIIASYEDSPQEISCLYEVFDKLRVVLRFSAISPENMTEAFFVYSQALNLFIKFGNERGIEVCNREIGYICFKKKQWEISSYYLNESLILAMKLGIYSEEEIARRKSETAKAYIKAGINRGYAMNLFGEALQTFQSYGDSTRVVMCSIEVAETSLEVKELDLPLLDFIEKNLEKCHNFERTIANQRFLFIKSSFLKSIGNYKEACILISNILELHSDFIPEIWLNSINLLISICHEKGIDWSKIEPLRSFRRFNRKDIVLIVSDSLTKGLISWNLQRFLKSILEENDRMSMLQFGSTFKVNFNLTRFPLNIIDLHEAKLITDEKRVLYDCIQEGFRQLRVNSLFKKKDGVCKECIIIITDCVDLGSKSKFQDFIKIVENSDVEVIVVNCYLEVRVFESLRMATEKCSIFHIKYQEQAKIVLKEIEAYLCPYKEVYLVDN
jgi:tetratricopeptide (TPR) repeat protein